MENLNVTNAIMNDKLLKSLIIILVFIYIYIYLFLEDIASSFYLRINIEVSL